LRSESGRVGVKGTVGMDENDRHLTGVGLEAKEAAGPYGKGKGREVQKQVCAGNL
jgi:hypothetical protein